MLTYLMLLSLAFSLLALALLLYTPFVVYSKIMAKPRWRVGRNYALAMVAALVIMGGQVYKGCLDLSLATVARTGDVEAVGKLLDQGANPNARWRGRSALQNAYDRNDGSMIKLLEGAGATR